MSMPLEQVGPTDATIAEAVNAGFIDKSFLPTPPPTGNGNDGTNGDGSGDGNDGNGSGGGGGRSEQTDALMTLRTLLSQYGLDELGDVLYNNYTSGMINLSNPDAIMFSIRNEPIYKKRFAANEARLKKGLPELDPTSYVELEKYYRQTMQANGLPAGFYDQTDDFSNLIAGDVSPAELQSRITEGFNAVAQADPAVKQSFAKMYGVGEAELAAYFLDPEKSAPLLRERARAAQIAGRAQEQAGIELAVGTAENLAKRGITGEQAMAGFSDMAKLGELNTTFKGEQEISTEQKIGATFGYDPQAQAAIDKRRRERIGEFLGGGKFAGTRGQTSGLAKAE